MARDDPKFMLRMPAALKARVEEAAKITGRSINAELVHRIAESFELPFDEKEMQKTLQKTIRTVLTELINHEGYEFEPESRILRRKKEPKE